MDRHGQPALGSSSACPGEAHAGLQRHRTPDFRQEVTQKVKNKSKTHRAPAGAQRTTSGTGVNVGVKVHVGLATRGSPLISLPLHYNYDHLESSGLKSSNEFNQFND